MEGYVSEQEQVEALKKWWKENGKAVLAGVVLGLGILFGGRAWIDYRHTQAEKASGQYAELMAAKERGDNAVAVQKGEEILKDYSSTPYATLAALALAEVKLAQGDTAAARTQLQWVADNAKQAGIKHVAQLRLGRVLISEGNPDAALALVPMGDTEGFAAAYEELKGDAYVVKGDIAQARAAYQKALDALEPTAPNRALLQMKLDDLGAAPKQEQVS